ncbi:MAG: trypsin-like peptidase domain-containing protein [Flavobacteriales bacterium]|nr:trypsin-like peptidase domain-containing protein [Flavobacteriales bacterium]MDP4818258.1 trypsin-like peptidase domain-containing protein [Flavobacteriales bacterium]
MIKKLLSVLAFSIAIAATAQVSFGGFPFNWEDKHVSSQISFTAMPSIDLDALAAEDAVVDQYKEAPYRFGFEHETSFGLNQATWRSIENERSIWQFGIECAGARTINLIFEDFYLPKGAEMFIWSADREEFLGSFNHKNNQEYRVLATSILQHDKVVVEVQANDAVKDQVSFVISMVVHGYRPVLMNHFADFDEDRGPYGTSGSCNNNVNCAVGSAWQVEKKSVALILSGGSASCTGALVNNTANDGTPYFLTANHCYSAGATPTWVFVFNHETSGCTGTTGPTNQTVSGCQLRARRAGSDFCLVELSSVPPASYNVEYAGWDASDATTVTSATCIHHPSGDLKKISFENNAVPQGTWSGAQTWDVQQWDDGITEPGSSGSPLFDQNHRIIGQLYGGGSACSGSNENGQGDSYGRFGVSWDAGASASARLKEWLDPGNTGILVLDGYPTGSVSLQLDASAASISNVPANICGSSVSPVFSLLNNGSSTLTSCTIQYTVNGGSVQTINWTGSVAQYASTNVNLPAITLTNGANTIVVTVLNPNGSADENANNNSVSVTCNAVVGPTVNITVGIIFDDYSEETSWEIQQNGAIIASSDGLYPAGGTSINESVCLAPGCYNFVIFDDYGDGLCCAYGNGSYSVSDATGTSLAAGGSFTNSETTNFCVSGSAVESIVESVVTLYPNPAQNEIQLIGAFANSDLYIIDVAGNVVVSTKTYSANVKVDTSSLANGYYIVKLVSAGKVDSLPLIIKK